MTTDNPTHVTRRPLSNLRRMHLRGEKSGHIAREAARRVADPQPSPALVVAAFQSAI